MTPIRPSIGRSTTEHPATSTGDTPVGSTPTPTVRTPPARDAARDSARLAETEARTEGTSVEGTSSGPRGRLGTSLTEFSRLRGSESPADIEAARRLLPQILTNIRDLEGHLSAAPRDLTRDYMLIRRAASLTTEFLNTHRSAAGSPEFRREGALLVDFQQTRDRATASLRHLREHILLPSLPAEGVVPTLDQLRNARAAAAISRELDDLDTARSDCQNFRNLVSRMPRSAFEGAAGHEFLNETLTFAGRCAAFDPMMGNIALIAANHIVWSMPSGDRVLGLYEFLSATEGLSGRRIDGMRGMATRYLEGRLSEEGISGSTRSYRALEQAQALLLLRSRGVEIEAPAGVMSALRGGGIILTRFAEALNPDSSDSPAQVLASLASLTPRTLSEHMAVRFGAAVRSEAAATDRSGDPLSRALASFDFATYNHAARLDYYRAELDELSGGEVPAGDSLRRARAAMTSIREARAEIEGHLSDDPMLRAFQLQTLVAADRSTLAMRRSIGSAYGGAARELLGESDADFNAANSRLATAIQNNTEGLTTLRTSSLTTARDATASTATRLASYRLANQIDIALGSGNDRVTALIEWQTLLDSATDSGVSTADRFSDLGTILTGFHELRQRHYDERSLDLHDTSMHWSDLVNPFASATRDLEARVVASNPSRISMSEADLTTHMSQARDGLMALLPIVNPPTDELATGTNNLYRIEVDRLVASTPGGAAAALAERVLPMLSADGFIRFQSEPTVELALLDQLTTQANQHLTTGHVTIDTLRAATSTVRMEDGTSRPLSDFISGAENNVLTFSDAYNGLSVDDRRRVLQESLHLGRLGEYRAALTAETDPVRHHFRAAMLALEEGETLRGRDEIQTFLHDVRAPGEDHVLRPIADPQLDAMRTIALDMNRRLMGAALDRLATVSSELAAQRSENMAGFIDADNGGNEVTIARLRELINNPTMGFASLDEALPVIRHERIAAAQADFARSIDAEAPLLLPCGPNVVNMGNVGFLTLSEASERQARQVALEAAAYRGMAVAGDGDVETRLGAEGLIPERNTRALFDAFHEHPEIPLDGVPTVRLTAHGSLTFVPHRGADRSRTSVLRVEIPPEGGSVMVDRGGTRLVRTSFGPSDHPRFVLLYHHHGMHGSSFRSGVVRTTDPNPPGLERELDPILTHVFNFESRAAIHERAASPDANRRASLALAGELRTRGGSYAAAARIYEEVMADAIHEAQRSIPAADLARITREAEESRPTLLREIHTRVFDMVERGMPRPTQSQIDAMVNQAVHARIEANVRVMTFTRIRDRRDSLDPIAREAWDSYNDMMDPLEEWLNFSDSTVDRIIDEVVVNLAFTIASGGLAGAAAGATRVAATRLATRWLASEGTSLIGERAALWAASSGVERFGGRAVMWAMGESATASTRQLTARALIWGTGVVVEGAVFHTSMTGMQSTWGYLRHGEWTFPPPGEFAMGTAHSILMMGSISAGGALWGRVATEIGVNPEAVARMTEASRAERMTRLAVHHVGALTTETLVMTATSPIPENQSFGTAAVHNVATILELRVGGRVFGHLTGHVLERYRATCENEVLQARVRGVVEHRMGVDPNSAEGRLMANALSLSLAEGHSIDAVSGMVTRERLEVLRRSIRSELDVDPNSELGQQLTSLLLAHTMSSAGSVRGMESAVSEAPGRLGELNSAIRSITDRAGVTGDRALSLQRTLLARALSAGLNAESFATLNASVTLLMENGGFGTGAEAASLRVTLLNHALTNGLGHAEIAELASHADGLRARLHDLTNQLYGDGAAATSFGRSITAQLLTWALSQPGEAADLPRRLEALDDALPQIIESIEASNRELGLSNSSVEGILNFHHLLSWAMSGEGGPTQIHERLEAARREMPRIRADIGRITETLGYAEGTEGANRIANALIARFRGEPGSESAFNRTAMSAYLNTVGSFSREVDFILATESGAPLGPLRSRVITFAIENSSTPEALHRLGLELHSGRRRMEISSDGTLHLVENPAIAPVGEITLEGIAPSGETPAPTGVTSPVVEAAAEPRLAEAAFASTELSEAPIGAATPRPPSPAELLPQVHLLARIRSAAGVSRNAETSAYLRSILNSVRSGELVLTEEMATRMETIFADPRTSEAMEAAHPLQADRVRTALIQEVIRGRITSAENIGERVRAIIERPTSFEGYSLGRGGVPERVAPRADFPEIASTSEGFAVLDRFTHIRGADTGVIHATRDGRRGFWSQARIALEGLADPGQPSGPLVNLARRTRAALETAYERASEIQRLSTESPDSPRLEAARRELGEATRVLEAWEAQHTVWESALIEGTRLEEIANPPFGRIYSALEPAIHEYDATGSGVGARPRSTALSEVSDRIVSVRHDSPDAYELADAWLDPARGDQGRNPLRTGEVVMVVRNSGDIGTVADAAERRILDADIFRGTAPEIRRSTAADGTLRLEFSHPTEAGIRFSVRIVEASVERSERNAAEASFERAARYEAEETAIPTLRIEIPTPEVSARREAPTVRPPRPGSGDGADGTVAGTPRSRARAASTETEAPSVAIDPVAATEVPVPEILNASDGMLSPDMAAPDAVRFVTIGGANGERIAANPTLRIQSRGGDNFGITNFGSEPFTVLRAGGAPAESIAAPRGSDVIIRAGDRIRFADGSEVAFMPLTEAPTGERPTVRPGPPRARGEAEPEAPPFPRSLRGPGVNPPGTELPPDLTDPSGLTGRWPGESLPTEFRSGDARFTVLSSTVEGSGEGTLGAGEVVFTIAEPPREVGPNFRADLDATREFLRQNGVTPPYRFIYTGETGGRRIVVEFSEGESRHRVSLHRGPEGTEASGSPVSAAVIEGSELRVDLTEARAPFQTVTLPGREGALRFALGLGGGTTVFNLTNQPFTVIRSDARLAEIREIASRETDPAERDSILNDPNNAARSEVAPGTRGANPGRTLIMPGDTIRFADGSELVFQPSLPGGSTGSEPSSVPPARQTVPARARVRVVTAEEAPPEMPAIPRDRALPADLMAMVGGEGEMVEVDPIPAESGVRSTGRPRSEALEEPATATGTEGGERTTVRPGPPRSERTSDAPGSASLPSTGPIGEAVGRGRRLAESDSPIARHARAAMERLSRTREGTPEFRAALAEVETLTDMTLAAAISLPPRDHPQYTEALGMRSLARGAVTSMGRAEPGSAEYSRGIESYRRGRETIVRQLVEGGHTTAENALSFLTEIGSETSDVRPGPVRSESAPRSSGDSFASLPTTGPVGEAVGRGRRLAEGDSPIARHTRAAMERLGDTREGTPEFRAALAEVETLTEMANASGLRVPGRDHPTYREALAFQALARGAVASLGRAEPGSAEYRDGIAAYRRGRDAIARELVEAHRPAMENVLNFLTEVGAGGEAWNGVHERFPFLEAPRMSEGIAPHGRLKAESDVLAKLNRRGWTSLDTMTDFAGTRAVVESYEDVTPLLAAIQSRYTIREVRDADGNVVPGRDRDTMRRLIEGARSGYRAIHIVVEVEGRPVEIQVQTRAMYEWGIIQHGMIYSEVRGTGESGAASSTYTLSGAARSAADAYCREVATYLADVEHGASLGTRPSSDAVVRALPRDIPAEARESVIVELNAMDDLMSETVARLRPPPPAEVEAPIAEVISLNAHRRHSETPAAPVVVAAAAEASTTVTDPITAAEAPRPAHSPFPAGPEGAAERGRFARALQAQLESRHALVLDEPQVSALRAYIDAVNRGEEPSAELTADALAAYSLPVTSISPSGATVPGGLLMIPAEAPAPNSGSRATVLAVDEAMGTVRLRLSNGSEMTVTARYPGASPFHADQVIVFIRAVEGGSGQSFRITAPAAPGTAGEIEPSRSATEFRVGRNHGSTDGMMSREHAVFRRDAHGRWTVEDLGSSNGVTVLGPDGRPMRIPPNTPVLLEDRAELVIGSHRYTFRHPLELGRVLPLAELNPGVPEAPVIAPPPGRNRFALGNVIVERAGDHWYAVGGETRVRINGAIRSGTNPLQAGDVIEVGGRTYRFQPEVDIHTYGSDIAEVRLPGRHRSDRPVNHLVVGGRLSADGRTVEVSLSRFRGVRQTAELLRMPREVADRLGFRFNADGSISGRESPGEIVLEEARPPAPSFAPPTVYTHTAPSVGDGAYRSGPAVARVDVPVPVDRDGNFYSISGDPTVVATAEMLGGLAFVGHPVRTEIHSDGTAYVTFVGRRSSEANERQFILRMNAEAARDLGLSRGDAPARNYRIITSDGPARASTRSREAIPPPPPALRVTASDGVSYELRYTDINPGPRVNPEFVMPNYIGRNARLLPSTDGSVRIAMEVSEFASASSNPRPGPSRSVEISIPRDRAIALHVLGSDGRLLGETIALHRPSGSETGAPSGGVAPRPPSPPPPPGTVRFSGGDGPREFSFGRSTASSTPDLTVGDDMRMISRSQATFRLEGGRLSVRPDAAEGTWILRNGRTWEEIPSGSDFTALPEGTMLAFGRPRDVRITETGRVAESDGNPQDNLIVMQVRAGELRASPESGLRLTSGGSDPASVPAPRPAVAPMAPLPPPVPGTIRFPAASGPSEFVFGRSSADGAPDLTLGGDLRDISRRQATFRLENGRLSVRADTDAGTWFLSGSTWYEITPDRGFVNLPEGTRIAFGRPEMARRGGATRSMEISSEGASALTVLEVVNGGLRAAPEAGLRWASPSSGREAPRAPAPRRAAEPVVVPLSSAARESSGTGAAPSLVVVGVPPAGGRGSGSGHPYRVSGPETVEGNQVYRLSLDERGAPGHVPSAIELRSPTALDESALEGLLSPRGRDADVEVRATYSDIIPLADMPNGGGAAPMIDFYVVGEEGAMNSVASPGPSVAIVDPMASGDAGHPLFALQRTASGYRLILQGEGVAVNDASGAPRPSVRGNPRAFDLRPGDRVRFGMTELSFDGSSFRLPTDVSTEARLRVPAGAMEAPPSSEPSGGSGSRGRGPSGTSSPIVPSGSTGGPSGSSALAMPAGVDPLVVARVREAFQSEVLRVARGHVHRNSPFSPIYNAIPVEFTLDATTGALVPEGAANPPRETIRVRFTADLEAGRLVFEGNSREELQRLIDNGSLTGPQRNVAEGILRMTREPLFPAATETVGEAGASEIVPTISPAQLRDLQAAIRQAVGATPNMAMTVMGVMGLALEPSTGLLEADLHFDGSGNILGVSLSRSRFSTARGTTYESGLRTPHSVHVRLDDRGNILAVEGMPLEGDRRFEVPAGITERQLTAITALYRSPESVAARRALSALNPEYLGVIGSSARMAEVDSLAHIISGGGAGSRIAVLPGRSGGYTYSAVTDRVPTGALAVVRVEEFSSPGFAGSRAGSFSYRVESGNLTPLSRRAFEFIRIQIANSAPRT